MASVDVRLFASLRDLAGTASLRVDADTVGEVVEALSVRYGERFARIAASGTVVVDGERSSSDRRLADGEEVALLPPFSGGAGPEPLAYS
jgi:MoaD family protein